jgi:TolB-like protein/Tfp pilus assembly protein PilF
VSYQRFFAELKRRKVFQVAALYGAVGFVVLQIADLTFPLLGLPEWSVTLVLALTMIGFPIALVLAWALESSPEGIRRTPSAAPGDITQIIEQPASRRWQSGLLALLGVILLFGSGWWIGRRGVTSDAVANGSGTTTATRARDGSGRTAIAVLPFENIAGDDESEYFVDGVHDEIITQLSKVRRLSVTSRTSVMAYKDERPSLREVASALGVDVVLEGSVRRDAERVRITAQLIDAGSDQHLWAESYDRELTDILAIQSDVALKVARALEAQLTPEESASIEAPLTSNLDAYDLYLRGKEQVYASFQESSLRSAEQLFRRATELDPTFAAAFAYLSIAHGRIYWFFFDRSPELAAAALAAADSALALDPTLPAAHLARGIYYYRIALDYEQALNELAEASRLQPSGAEIELATSWVYRRMGEFEEALRRGREAQRREPRYPRVAFTVGETLALMRRYEDAVQELERAVELDPARGTTYYWLAKAHLGADNDAARALDALDRGKSLDVWETFSPILKIDLLLLDREYAVALGVADDLPGSLGSQFAYRTRNLLTGLIHSYAGDSAQARQDFAAAVVELEALVADEPDDPRYRSALGIAYAGLGRHEEAVAEARRAVDILPTEREAMRGPYHEQDLALVLTMTGAYEEAIDVLDEMLRRPNQLTLAELRLHPAWDPLRDEPRFKELIAEADGS